MEENKEQKKVDESIKENSQQQVRSSTSPKSKKTLFIILGILAALFACVVIIVGAGVFIAGRAAKSGLENLEKKAKSFKYEDKKSGSSAEAGEEVKKPDNWPKDIPIYEGKIKYSSSVKDKTFMIGLDTSDDSSTILKFYKKEMEKRGWKEQSKGNYSDTKTVSYSKEAEKRTATVSISKDAVSKDKNYVAVNTTSY